VSYVGFLTAALAGAVTFVYAAVQPTRLENPGLAAYHPPAAVVLYPLPSTYTTPPAPVEEAQAEPEPVRQKVAAVPAADHAASEPAAAHKKSKQHVARRDPRQDYASARSGYARAAYAQYDYGSYHPW
jgi:hypothetical protein